MVLGLGNDRNGQFFTPYSVCRMMAKMECSQAIAEVESKGWISCNDCACGAGALLVAFANECKENNINYQTSVLFTAQDIDYTTALMCYLQLSLLGCPGYVAVGDTLTDPCISVDKRGLIPVDRGNIWYTPFYFTDVWRFRRQAAQMDMILKRADSVRNREVNIREVEEKIQERKAIVTKKRKQVEETKAIEAEMQLSFF